jgi:hypothetical protein
MVSRLMMMMTLAVTGTVLVAAAFTSQAGAASWRGAAAIHGAADANTLAKPAACGWVPDRLCRIGWRWDTRRRRCFPC